MASFAEIILHRRPIEAFAAAGLLGRGSAIEHAHSLGGERIPLTPLLTGRHFLEQWQLRELPDQGLWRASEYMSHAPPVFVVHDALVHSSAGLVGVGDQLIAETLDHAVPAQHGFRMLAKGVALQTQGIQRLPGVHISLLTGAAENYYHSLLLSLARLCAVPETHQAAAMGLLVPEHGARQRETLALLDPRPSLRVREVKPGETLRVEHLILPLTVTGDSVPHPCVRDFFRTLSMNVPPASRPTPRRLYIDRRGERLRPLANEAELVGALGRLGFVAVKPDQLSVMDQARLFRGAEVIVAPHGGALTNLGFCRPGTRVIELLMDAYCNWSFRHLAGLMGLNYDCVLGRARAPWGELTPAFHLTPWEVPVSHVVAAAARLVERQAA